MRPSTSSSSASTNGPAPASACAPVSAATSTSPSLILRHRAYAGTGTTGPDTATTTVAVTTAATGTTITDIPRGLAQPPTYAPEQLPLGNDPNHYKRGPSPSLDGQSPDSSGSLTAGRDNVSTVLNDHRTKKRRTGPGSRGVANLTPEQLAKKRANDREAQRAIRERTKNQIEALQDQIRVLTEQQPYQELQKVIREKNAIEARNAALEALLRSLATSIQAGLSGNTTEDALVTLAATLTPPIQSTQQQEQLPSYPAHNSSTLKNESTPHSNVASAWRKPTLLQSTSLPNPGSHGVEVSIQKRRDSVLNWSVNNEYSKFDPLDPSQCLDRVHIGASTSLDSLQAYPPAHIKYEWNAPVHLKHDNNAIPSSASPPPPPALPTLAQCMEYTPSTSSSSPIPYVTIEGPIKHITSTHPVDALLLSLMDERRQRVAKGESTQDVVGPTHPSIYLLLNPHEDIPSSDPQSKRSLTEVCTEIMSKFSLLDKLPERVAVLYVVYYVMRWHISPTPDNYELIPPFAKPLDIQFTKPHPPWVDYVPFPQLREVFVHYHDCPGYDFDTMFLPYTQTLSVNWPYEDEDVLHKTPNDIDVSINPIFQKHLLNIDNWTLGDAFDRMYPALRGMYNLKSEGCGINNKEIDLKVSGGRGKKAGFGASAESIRRTGSIGGV
ncbi:hypothetical protein O1611_g9567 [Lasiodiplodia mahajangana]|uniref:Uncharacterized protein n=1 Tax=Lasiodiplodia mahajangana TaxID=1108764 RepID=A0ACC2J806_9PEZI|nr:hypothetical protein O1611_g9567 [Lasiodiplodia mahajangana]